MILVKSKRWPRNCGRVRRNDGTEGNIAQLVARPEPPAPMRPVCFTRVTKESPILDRVVWHPDPLSLDEHLHPGWLHSVGRRATIPVIAAIPSGSVF